MGLQLTDRGAALSCKACLDHFRTVWLGLHVRAAGHRGGAMGFRDHVPAAQLTVFSAV